MRRRSSLRHNIVLTYDTGGERAARAGPISENLPLCEGVTREPVPAPDWFRCSRGSRSRISDGGPWFEYGEQTTWCGRERSAGRASIAARSAGARRWCAPAGLRGPAAERRPPAAAQVKRHNSPAEAGPARRWRPAPRLDRVIPLPGQTGPGPGAPSGASTDAGTARLRTGRLAVVSGLFPSRRAAPIVRPILHPVPPRSVLYRVARHVLR